MQYHLFGPSDMMDITIDQDDATVIILEVEESKDPNYPSYRVYEHIGPAKGEIYSIGYQNYKGPHKMKFDLDAAIALSRTCNIGTKKESTQAYEALLDMTAGLSYARINSLLDYRSLTEDNLALISILQDLKAEAEK